MPEDRGEVVRDRARQPDAEQRVDDQRRGCEAAIERFDGDAQVATWLHRIVVNTCLMRLRRARRRPERSLDSPTGDAFDPRRLQLETRAEAADRLLERQEQIAALHDALSGLPAAHRAVLRLRDLEERSTREAAAMLGVSDNAVKLRLLRARKALGRGLQHRLRSRVARRRHSQEHA